MRPLKQNADYFSHDNDMRNDEKIKAIRHNFKHDGYSVWNMILEKLCKADNFKIKYTGIDLELMAGDFEIDTARLKDMIDYFIKIDLLQNETDYIYSKHFIDRLQPLFSKRERQRKGLSLAITKNKGVIVSESTQSKVKERKGKESKVNITTTTSGKPDKPKSKIEQDFDTFWSVYPKKKSRHDATRAWKKAKPDITAVLSALSWQKASADWVKDNGQYIPHPATYINRGGYLDENPSQYAKRNKEVKKDIYIEPKLKDEDFATPEQMAEHRNRVKEGIKEVPKKEMI